MAHYLEDKTHNYAPKPISVDIHTKIQENKPSFCIDALLARDPDVPGSPETSRSMSPTSSVHSQSPPISPGSEDVHHNPFVPRPGLLNQIYPTAAAHAIYGYQTGPSHMQTSAFHSLDGTGMVQKVQLPVNHGHNQLHQMQLEWLARTGMFYPRIPDLTEMAPAPAVAGIIPASRIPAAA
ncbi:extra-extra [Carabus blaptoides fortunei]